MRCVLPILLVLLVPGTAEAATVGREGTELVYRSAPGQEDLFEAREEAGALTFAGREGGDARITPAAGCTLARKLVRCPVDGVTAVRVFAGDSDDQVSFYRVWLPLFVDLGPGSDDFGAVARALTVTGGEGSDSVDFEADAATIDLGPGDDLAGTSILDTFVGPLTIEGGDGDDLFSVGGRSRAGIALSGGAGDDEFNLLTRGPGLDVACGPGADVTRLALADRPGDGCAAHVTLPDPRRVSRAFSATLTARAAGSVEFRRGRSLLARRPFSAPAGPLRLRLKTTATGRRSLRRDPDPAVFVTVKTRTGGDRNEIEFRSRLR